ncbi:hypothetical protein [Actinoplanes derwentensis]|uniref:Uncharacterized protein n=1 Tax=Actinoplanes derwentensis TaxID=113562 RepID=A0A1H2DDL1_9ACTN|nr:hypothetical protein [Actinoplanes derwentensis]GID89639.1 hypothetical protein Ade03nite_85630 [Actinoplanes derwentensis]SDT80674.1 hypothetical protein SAMN04489716_9308 [Actinoplanes derwentensis]
MANEGSADEQPPDPAQGWAVICREYPKIKQRAYAIRQHDVVRELRSKPHDDETLTAWFTLREQLRRQDRREQGNAKDALGPVDKALAKIVGSPFPADESTYVCPGYVCALRSRDLAGEAPYCELTGKPMEPER